jgi:lipoyl(octanoyl) transferase
VVSGGFAVPAGWGHSRGPIGDVEVTEGRPLSVLELGVLPYAEALELQADLIVKRRAGDISDTLLLLEHPHVITMGSGAHEEHVLVSEAEREQMGIELFKAGRGGDVTYHGPGQLIAYPILDLKPGRKDIHAYLRDLESVVMSVANAYGVEGERSTAGTGVWTSQGKLAAIGVRVSSGWITSHGIALNVSSDLSYFSTIVPCGIRGHGVTSLERELGTTLGVSAVGKVFAYHFAECFGHLTQVA